ncbi:MAG: helix-turn-helix domain-containing protein [Clostridia bacterium]|nr:helix-turn-helix domain-containing protein [Clostridia bacterium]
MQKNQSEITRKTLFSADKSRLTVFHSFVPAEESAFYEHHHTAFEITMVKSGSGIYATNASEFAFKENDVFFFSTDEIHWLKKLDCPTTFINIHFEPRFIWSSKMGISNTELLKIFFKPKNKAINKMHEEGGFAEAVRELILKIESESISKKPEYETLLKVHLMNILVEMIRAYDGELSDTDILYTSHTLRYMEKVLNYIDSHFEADLSLDELSDVAHMSKTYFCRQFKELNGISPWDYITIKRIEQAISYIETTNLTKLEIAAKCGYNNTSNFYHAFKKVTGKNPSDYKK